jgi:tRNA G18 (ribose-2'-O)-methylase SpoU
MGSQNLKVYLYPGLKVVCRVSVRAIEEVPIVRRVRDSSLVEELHSQGSQIPGGHSDDYRESKRSR